MIVKTKRYFDTTCHIVSFTPTELELEPHNGTPGKRENIHNMWGSPDITEVTCLKANAAFFNGDDPKSEMIGVGRGDAFLNVAWDGQKIYMEPDIPKGLKEISSSYALTKNGQKVYTNENFLKAIIGKNPRMIMGQRANGEVVFIAAEGRRLTEKGLTSEEERSVCGMEGLRNSFNNDGGGSTVLIVEDKQLNKAYDGRTLGYIWVGYRKWKRYELPFLKKGAKGMWVNLLQRMLYIPADGTFGRQTEEQVRAYQRTYDLDVDGKVGPDTWNSLCNVHKL